MKTYQQLLGRNKCPGCGSNKLRVVAVIDKEGFHPGHSKHNIGYHHVMLVRCEKCSHGLIERLDHDCFDWESVFDQYEWYILNEADLRRLLEGLISCPNPMAPKCECQIHESLRHSIETLPKKYWETAFEDDRHEHQISINWKNSLPLFIEK